MCKYRVRCFSSKGAFLVLVWTLLVTIGFTSIYSNVSVYLAQLCSVNVPNWILVIPLVLGLFGAVFSGWLADAKLGNYRVTKYSIVLLFVTSLCSSILTLLPCSVHNVYTVAVCVCLGGSALILAGIAFMVTALQLGLDQMPDASSASITSFIAWFVFCIYFGVWIATFIYYTEHHCFIIKIWHTQLYGLVSPVCITVVLVSDFVLAEKWLLIEPKSPQSLKTIYQVLKFAAKHKAPLNRSALTYWEEDIPSRMDLGKSRYGGPFTTEQVEDVKTILRLIPLCLTLWLLGSVLSIFDISTTYDIKLSHWTACENKFLRLFTYNAIWCGVIWTVFYEFVIYPVVKNRLPSILKRIGIISCLIVISSILFLTLELVLHYHGELKGNAIDNVKGVLHSISKGLLSLLLASTMLEFVCAQAPYNMRGKFGGWIVFVLVSSILFLEGVFTHSVIMYDGIGTGISLFGLVLYCLLARWYKRRVRDEEYNVHRVVEEVYDRYLSAR